VADAPAADLERLYGLDLDEFIPSRDATVRRLRGEGRSDEANAVKAIRKPSNPAWVVNRLARVEPGVVGELLAAGRSLRKLQLGGGGGDALRLAIDDERRALDRAMRNAEEIATHAKLASQATLDRVRETLHLAALDADVGAQVEQGVLVKEGRASGFTDLSGFVPAALESPAPKAKGGRSAAAAERAAAKERERHERAVARARDKVAAAAKELATVERELDRAQAAVDKAQRKVDAARRTHADAEAHLAELGEG
jgi:hypothetical protein